jgi:hypothetical protein
MFAKSVVEKTFVSITKSFNIVFYVMAVCCANTELHAVNAKNVKEEEFVSTKMLDVVAKSVAAANIAVIIF